MQDALNVDYGSDTLQRSMRTAAWYGSSPSSFHLKQCFAGNRYVIAYAESNINSEIGIESARKGHMNWTEVDVGGNNRGQKVTGGYLGENPVGNIRQYFNRVVQIF